MRALQFDHFGPPSVLRIVDRPQPVPASDEALVEVRAAGINPSDVKNVAGGMPQTKPPRVPGRDFAGVVISGPAEWQGAAVWGTGGDLGFTRDGTHAEMLTVPVRGLSRKPNKLTWTEAGAVGTPWCTAMLGLTRTSLAKGHLVLVIGAAGSVGGAAVQIARWRGAHVIGVVLEESDVAVARSFGAERVVVHGPGDDGRELRTALGSDEVDLALDTSGVSLDLCVGTLRHGGRVAVITAPPDGKVTFNERQLYRREAAIFGIDSLARSASDGVALLDELAPGFESGALQPPRVVARPLDQAVTAYGERGAKMVLVPKSGDRGQP
jgi:NADPH:quinone reductase-like Zn-dependent oxidoreductase